MTFPISFPAEAKMAETGHEFDYAVVVDGTRIGSIFMEGGRVNIIDNRTNSTWRAHCLTPTDLNWVEYRDAIDNAFERAISA